jgi:hypothetical protein
MEKYASLLAGNNYSEDRLQQVIVLWFRNTWPKFGKLLHSIPNGGNRNSREMKFLKTTGLTPGASDLILQVGGMCYNIELKKIGGVQSKVQKEFESQVRASGGNYVIFNKFLPAAEYIERIMNHHQLKPV